MNDATQLPAPRSANRVWSILKRTLAAIVVVLAVVALVSSLAGLIGVWVARAPARDAVTAVSTILNGTLATIGQGLARVDARVNGARQALTRIDESAHNLGDRIESSSPVLNLMSRTIGDDLATNIADSRASAGAIRDGVVSFNATLEAIDRIPGMNVPTLTDELRAVSDRIDAAQTDVQELRATVAEAKAGASASLVAAVTTRTARIDGALAQVRAIVARYEATTTQMQAQVTSVANRLLSAINLIVVALTVFFLVLAAGQALLIYVLWQYVRTGQFPSLRVTRA